MDTLAIIEKLKKKRPDLANDPLFAELEMAQMDDMEAMSEDMPMGAPPAAGGASSYLDEPDAAIEGEAGADALMDDLDAEADMGAPEDVAPATDEEAGASSYLDAEEEDEEEMMKKKPARTKQTSRGFGRFAR